MKAQWWKETEYMREEIKRIDSGKRIVDKERQTRIKYDWEQKQEQGHDYAAKGIRRLEGNRQRGKKRI